eukprot:6212596-Pleurochrysis_carterae.AAC.6
MQGGGECVVYCSAIAGEMSRVRSTMRMRGGRAGTIRQWSSSLSQIYGRGGRWVAKHEGECCPCMQNGSKQETRQHKKRCQRVECEKARKYAKTCHECLQTLNKLLYGSAASNATSTGKRRCGQHCYTHSSTRGSRGSSRNSCYGGRAMELVPEETDGVDGAAGRVRSVHMALVGVDGEGAGGGEEGRAADAQQLLEGESSEGQR